MQGPGSQVLLFDSEGFPISHFSHGVRRHPVIADDTTLEPGS